MNLKTAHKAFKFLTLLIGISYLTACEQNSPGEKINTIPVTINERYEALTEQEIIEKPNLPIDLKIIKSATVKYKVTDVKSATQKIKNYAFQHDAYISDLRFENNRYSLENRFTLKVPQQHFETMMDSMVKVAEFVDYENITSEDVTEHYIDIQTRLKTKLEVKERYESVLQKNAKTVEDILATEEKLRIIQEEIEASQGKLKYLSNKVGYSTIQIDLYETVDYKEEPETYAKSFWSKSKEGLLFGWEIIESLVLGIIYIWPLVLIGFVLGYLIKKRWNKKNSN